MIIKQDNMAEWVRVIEWGAGLAGAIPTDSLPPLRVQWDTDERSSCIHTSHIERIPPDPIIRRKLRSDKGPRLLTESEMLRFQSIQDLLVALEYIDDQATRRLINMKTRHTVDFDDIAGYSVPEFVRSGLHAGWLGQYLKQDIASPEKSPEPYEPYSRMAGSKRCSSK